MKTSKIEIPYDPEDPSKVALADVPTQCEVAHVSGDRYSAFLHITEADEPAADRTPTAFFVIRDGVDVPGMVITKDRHKPTQNPNLARDFDDDGVEKTKTYVRRIGKFESDDGDVMFVFERLS